MRCSMPISLGCVVLASCATALNPAGLRIDTDYVPAGSLRLAEVVQLSTRAEVIDSKPIYEAILSSGIRDSDVRDGSVVFARIYCCGGPNERHTVRILFVPQAISVERGDIVEVRTGRPPAPSAVGQLNTVTKIWQKGPSGACRWIPPDPNLWARVLYCDWMPANGWIEQTGVLNAWYKPGA